MIFRQALRRAAQISRITPTANYHAPAVHSNTASVLLFGSYDTKQRSTSYYDYNHENNCACIFTAGYGYETGSLGAIQHQRTQPGNQAAQQSAFSYPGPGMQTYSCPRSPLTRLAASTTRLTWHKSMTKINAMSCSLPTIMENEEIEIERLGMSDDSLKSQSSAS
eukprot:CAMPEP_0184695556 /NCGR_PEP_ID=MMETSP0313-20130426/3158_1 /TAXON_ID=2792 /ORGANISM="Porphyridium aerugineum, Strain SAG 1380-2" /LENGTH=164 /DNA_ID=CAMNT_0027154043 /DNA_START=446 /DNA_END=940 /DNA_ORIENTATION=+